MVQFNLNERVAIELKDNSMEIIKSKLCGDEHHKNEYVKHCVEPYVFTFPHDNKKYMWMSMYEVMFYFGDKMIMGCNPPIGLNIFLKKENFEELTNFKVQ